MSTEGAQAQSVAQALESIHRTASLFEQISGWFIQLRDVAPLLALSEEHREELRAGMELSGWSSDDDGDWWCTFEDLVDYSRNLQEQVDSLLTAIVSANWHESSSARLAEQATLTASLRQELDDLAGTSNVDERLLELAKKAIDLSIAAPEDAIMQARRAKDYITDILRGKGQTTTDAIRDVSDQIARSYLYLINALGNVAAHEQADRLTKEDALVAATALVRVLKWWQDTG
jgi:hypothetical protein